MILVVGPSGAGKTLLLKQLEDLSKNQDQNNVKKKEKDRIDQVPGSNPSLKETMVKVPATQPTIGSNISTCNFGKKMAVTLREVGGSMGPLWKNYYEEAKKIIYVIDMSNPFQVSATVIQLLQMLKSKQLEKTPFLLLLNKIDIFSIVSHVEMKSLLQLSNITHHAKQPITVIESSVKHGSGLQEAIDWMLSSDQ